MFKPESPVNARKLTDDEQSRAHLHAAHLAIDLYGNEKDRAVAMASATGLMVLLCAAFSTDPATQMELIADNLMQKAAAFREGKFNWVRMDDNE